MALGLAMGTASAAMAADPIVGTWKLDVSESKLVPSLSPPKAQTEVYRELGSGQIELGVSQEPITKDAFTSTNPVLAEKGEGSFRSPRGGLPKGVTAVETLFEPRDWYVTFSHGREAGHGHAQSHQSGPANNASDNQGTGTPRVGRFSK